MPFARLIRRLAWTFCVLSVPVLVVVASQFTQAHGNVMMSIAAAQARASAMASAKASAEAAAVSRAQATIAVEAAKRGELARQLPVALSEALSVHTIAPSCKPKHHNHPHHHHHHHHHPHHPYAAADSDEDDD